MVLIKQVHQKMRYFVTIGILQIKFQRHVCNRFHDVLMMSINLNDIAILNINSADFCCIINGISISDALNLLKKADLAKKGVL